VAKAWRGASAVKLGNGQLTHQLKIWRHGGVAATVKTGGWLAACGVVALAWLAGGYRPVAGVAWREILYVSQCCVAILASAGWNRRNMKSHQSAMQWRENAIS
jgi:hypothetical protein